MVWHLAIRGGLGYGGQVSGAAQDEKSRAITPKGSRQLYPLILH
jgi:hypothetical protein